MLCFGGLTEAFVMFWRVNRFLLCFGGLTEVFVLFWRVNYDLCYVLEGQLRF